MIIALGVERRRTGLEIGERPEQALRPRAADRRGASPARAGYQSEADDALGSGALANVVVLQLLLCWRGPRSSGKTGCARAAASRMICASISARERGIPAAGHSQTNATGPGGASGHTHSL